MGALQTHQKVSSAKLVLLRKSILKFVGSGQLISTRSVSEGLDAADSFTIALSINGALALMRLMERLVR